MPLKKDKRYSIVIFSGSRAEYYILEPLVLALSERDNLDITFLIHHNYTDTNIENIENKNIKIIELSLLLSREDKKYNSKYMHSYVISNIVKQVSDVMIKNELDFDLAIAYADRFETFGFSIATSQAGIPLLHMEAGDITNGGTPDDNVRHAITKLSHLFMTSTESGIDLLISFKEDSWRVYHSGLLGYSALNNYSFSKFEIRDLVKKYSLNNKFEMLIIATMHPLPFNKEKSIFDANQVFQSLVKFSKKFRNVEVFITSPNSDSGSKEIQNLIDKITFKSIKKINSLGIDYQKILSLSKEKKVVLLGNSSSVIKEAPFYNCHHINISQRQKNRVSASSQINLEAKSDDIEKALEKIYVSKSIQPKLEMNPYFKKEGIDGMVEFILEKIKLGKSKLLFKTIK